MSVSTRAIGTRTKVVYILGSARGGTGILGRALATIDGASHAGELRRLWSRGIRPGRTCGCGMRHADCEIWSGLLAADTARGGASLHELGELQSRAVPEKHAGWHALRILRSRPSSGDAGDLFLPVLSRTYAEFSHQAGSDVVLDNSKNPADAALLWWSDRVDAYVVQIVRDPRGVLYSRRTRSSPADPGRCRPIEAVQTSVYWMLRHVTFELIRRRYGPERSALVIYERFTEDPRAAVASVAHLVGVDPPTEGLAAGVPIELPLGHGPDSNGRFGERRVVLRPDDRWRTGLHPFDRALVGVLTAPLLRRYGYR